MSHGFAILLLVFGFCSCDRAGDHDYGRRLGDMRDGFNLTETILSLFREASSIVSICILVGIALIVVLFIVLLIIKARTPIEEEHSERRVSLIGRKSKTPKDNVSYWDIQKKPQSAVVQSIPNAVQTTSQDPQSEKNKTNKSSQISSIPVPYEATPIDKDLGKCSFPNDKTRTNSEDSFDENSDKLNTRPNEARQEESALTVPDENSNESKEEKPYENAIISRLKKTGSQKMMV